MEAGVVGISLIQRIRSALGGQGGCRDSLARDVGRLTGRLERLRAAFPDNPGLLDRVRLSCHVLNLLEEGCGNPVPAGGGVAR